MSVWVAFSPEAGMAWRWVRFEMPLMVCVEINERFEDARVVSVVAGAEEQDITVARDAEGLGLVYDESMERVSAKDLSGGVTLNVLNCPVAGLLVVGTPDSLVAAPTLTPAPRRCASWPPPGSRRGKDRSGSAGALERAVEERMAEVALLA
jgi:hypothetical protein